MMTSSLLIDGMLVILHAARPRPGMRQKSDLCGSLGVILLSSLRDLRSVLFQQSFRTMRRTDDRNMSRPVRIGTLENYYHQMSSIGQHLRLMSVPCRLPTSLLSARRVKPLGLGIRQQNLSVLRRT